MKATQSSLGGFDPQNPFLKIGDVFYNRNTGCSFIVSKLLIKPKDNASGARYQYKCWNVEMKGWTFFAVNRIAEHINIDKSYLLLRWRNDED